MSFVQTACPGCRLALRAPAAADQPLRCPRCAAVFRVRVPVPPSVAPKRPPALVPIPDPTPAAHAGSPGWWKVGVAGLVTLMLVGTAMAGLTRLLPRKPAAPSRPEAQARVPSRPEAQARERDEGHQFVYAGDGEKADKAKAPTYERDILPLVKAYCLRCHGGAKPKGGVTLSADSDDAAIRKNLKVWEKVGDNLRSGDMPPAGEKKPTAAEMDLLERWLDAVVYKVDCDGPQDPGRVTIRRLNRVEYNNTIRDLVGVDFKPAKDFPSDDVGYGFDNIGDVLSLPPLLMEKYLAAAEKIIEEAWKKPELRKKLMPRQPGGRDRQAMYENLKQFATRAYRRPVTDDEVKRLLGFVRLAREQGDSPELGAKLAFQAALVSPNFLFRVEKDPEKTDFIGQYELASRLSYFLWSSMPDDELFKLAREGKLREPAVLEAQVKRMLKDNKARALAENFAGQWLNTRSLGAFSPDPKKFPGFNDALRQAMVRETELFFLHVVREDRSVLDFLDADYTFVNAQLARHYGIKGVEGNSFQKVSLKGTPRGGVLTHASVLAVTSNPTRTSPVKRGKWILENILGTPPPPPPPDVPELAEGEKAGRAGSLRQQMEVHRKNPACATCHARMDPLGFGFENFDAVGGWRTKDGAFDVDPAGTLPDGSSFKGPAELRQVLLKKKDQFVRTLADRMLTYALGRGTERSDRCFTEQIAKETARSDYRFTALVLQVVKSDPFLKRRARGENKK